MKATRNILALLVVCLGHYSMAFDEEKCGDLFPKSGDAHRPYMSPIYSFTLVPSTTSYISSFGKCAMYSKVSPGQRELFIAKSYDQISTQAAQGGGEHMETLALLSGCSSEKTKQFSSLMKSNYDRVFRKASHADSKDLALQIDELISKNDELSKSCTLISLQAEDKNSATH
jgi:hypothetical protein